MRASDRVIVAGGGPAGSAAALCLARAGARVTLLDRALFPRPKLCGDTVNPGALSILDRLGVGGTARARGRRCTGMLVTGPQRSAVQGDYPPGITGLALERRELDLILLEAAAAAGVDVVEGVRILAPIADTTDRRVTGVRGRGKGGAFEMRAAVTIGADGRSSRLAAALGLARFGTRPQRWAYGTYFTGVTGLTFRGEMHIRADGYVGVAPLPRDLVNVCVVRERSRHGRPVPPDAVVSRAIDEDPLLRARFARASRVAPVVVLGPLAVDVDAAGCAGLLLAGDAAGFVDPMTGDGLRFALRGGELAAAAAVRELDTGTAAHPALALARRREFSWKWRLNRSLRALVASPRAVAAAAAVSRRWPAPIALLVRAAGDVHLAARSR